MELHQRVEVAGRPNQVWRVLWDVPRVSRCIPGCKQTETIEEGRHYKAVVEQRVGQFRAMFDLDITISSVDELRSLEGVARGRDRITKSILTSDFSLNLVPHEERSIVNFSAKVNLMGKLGSLGQAVVTRKSEEVVGQFVAALAEELAAEDSPEGRWQGP